MNKAPKYKHRRRNLGVGVAGVLVATGVLVDALHGSSTPDNKPNARVAAVQSITSAIGEKVVLKSGVMLHKTPELQEGGGDATNIPGPNNVETTVPKGEEYVVTVPLQGDDSNWIALSLPKKRQSTTEAAGPLSIQQRANTTVWAELPMLISEGYATVEPLTSGPINTYSIEITPTGEVLSDVPTVPTSSELAQAGQTTAIPVKS